MSSRAELREAARLYANFLAILNQINGRDGSTERFCIWGSLCTAMVIQRSRYTLYSLDELTDLTDNVCHICLFNPSDSQ